MMMMMIVDVASSSIYGDIFVVVSVSKTPQSESCVNGCQPSARQKVLVSNSLARRIPLLNGGLVLDIRGGVTIRAVRIQ